MRDLTLEECELVNGGDLWGEICQGIQNAWGSIFGGNNNNAPPQSLTGDQLTQLQTACINAIYRSGNGGTASVNGGGVSLDANGYYEAPINVSGGATVGQQTCVINPRTGVATIK